MDLVDHYICRGHCVEGFCGWDTSSFPVSANAAFALCASVRGGFEFRRGNSQRSSGLRWQWSFTGNPSRSSLNTMSIPHVIAMSQDMSNVSPGTSLPTSGAQTLLKLRPVRT